MTSDLGLAVIRAALLVRAKKGHLANLARDLSVGLATLEEFAHGRARLTNDILNALAAGYRRCEYQLRRDPRQVRRSSPEPTSMGIAPPPYVKNEPMTISAGGHTFYPPKKPEPKAQRRVQRGQRS